MDAARSFRALVALVMLAASLPLSGCARPQARVSGTQMIQPPPRVPQGGGFYHVVSRGQTIYRIAKLYKVDQKELMRLNGIKDPSALEVGQQIFVPQAAPVTYAQPGRGPVSLDEALRIIGPRRTSYQWRTITVHHSGTRQGSARNFDRNHRERKMGGLFYHFVIGNGTATRDGEVETGFRWVRQVKANRPNDIQICLVGNFDDQYVSEAQFATTVNLIKALQQTYGIPRSAVRQHCDIPGKHTDCPGKKFPFSRLLAAL